MYSIRKEGYKRKGIACIAFHCRTFAGSCRACDFRYSEEAQIYPRYEEAGEGEPERCVCAKQRSGEHVRQDEDGWKVLDPDSDHAFKKGDGMFWDQLLESYEEACFDCYEALDGCRTAVFVSN